MSNEIPNYDNWKTRTPDDGLKIFCLCDWCGEEIYEGEEYKEAKDDRVHSECFDDYVDEILDVRIKVAGE